MQYESQLLDARGFAKPEFLTEHRRHVRELLAVVTSALADYGDYAVVHAALAEPAPRLAVEVLVEPAHVRTCRALLRAPSDAARLSALYGIPVVVRTQRRDATSDVGFLVKHVTT